MFKSILRLLLICLALVAVVAAAVGIAPAHSLAVAAGEPEAATIGRIGLLYLAYLSVLFAIDQASPPTEPNGI